jgi:hypothetical protein
MNATRLGRSGPPFGRLPVCTQSACHVIDREQVATLSDLSRVSKIHGGARPQISAIYLTKGLPIVCPVHEKPPDSEERYIRVEGTLIIEDHKHVSLALFNPHSTALRSMRCLLSTLGKLRPDHHCVC